MKFSCVGMSELVHLSLVPTGVFVVIENPNLSKPGEYGFVV